MNTTARLSPILAKLGFELAPLDLAPASLDDGADEWNELGLELHCIFS